MNKYEGSIMIMKLPNIRISFRLFWTGGKRARTKLFKPFRRLHRKRLNSSGEFLFVFTLHCVVNYLEALYTPVVALKAKRLKLIKWKMEVLQQYCVFLSSLWQALVLSEYRELPKLEEKIPILHRYIFFYFRCDRAWVPFLVCQVIS